MRLNVTVNEKDKVNLKVQDMYSLKGISDYNQMVNKPSINGIPLEGNMDLSDFGFFDFKEFISRLDFPNIGKSNTLYLDKSTGNMYWYDTENTNYKVVGFDYEDICIISGGEI